ncbi:AraC family transcriptional regulator [Paraburkholderia sp.]|uniref:AraC family transcriptional regulator n=1 Tax=Paraburkholderia sp. TaxID=1926495 RepID=UPI0025F199B8|nr:AraC family transcriptional regulator [Paraburkholderia sp.]
MTILVRSATLSTFETLASGLGLDVPALLARFGIPLQALRDPDLLISYQAFINLLEYSASAGRCPDLGLRLAQARGIGILGPIAVLVRHADTLGNALALASRYLFVHSPALRLGTLTVPGRPDLIDVVCDISHANLIARPQVTSLSIGIICHGLKVLTGARVQPRLVTLPHAPVASVAAYRQAYGCPVQFMAPAATVRIAADDLAVALSENDPQVKALALSYLEQLGSRPQTLFSDRVRSLARNFLGAGGARHTDIARALSVHPRTLQRRLDAEGVTFERLVDDVRKEQFLALIALRMGPSLTQIAHVLGYAEVSVLTRSCRRWFGITPGAMRERAKKQWKEAEFDGAGMIPSEAG